MLISLSISGMFNQSSGISGYCARPLLPDGSSSWEQCGGLRTPWPQSEPKWLLGKPEWKNHPQILQGLKCCVFTIKASGLLSCGKTKPHRLIVPSPRSSTAALSSWSPVVHSEKKGGKNKNADSLRGNYAALEGSDTYKKLWWEESGVSPKALLVKQLFFRLVHENCSREKLYRSLA